MREVLKFLHVTKTFSQDPLVQPLCDANLSIRENCIACISGVSGKGKSTLLNIAGGLLKPNEGEVLFNGQNLVLASSEYLDTLHQCGIGFIFQIPYLVEALTVRENLALTAKVSKNSNSEMVDALLEEFGLIERADYMPHTLSVGQKRRVVIARAFMQPHSLILADEPTNDLDSAWSDYVFERLTRFAHGEGHAVVVVTHDETYAKRADVRYRLEGGQLILLKGQGC